MARWCDFHLTFDPPIDDAVLASLRAAFLEADYDFPTGRLGPAGTISEGKPVGATDDAFSHVVWREPLIEDEAISVLLESHGVRGYGWLADQLGTWGRLKSPDMSDWFVFGERTGRVAQVEAKIALARQRREVQRDLMATEKAILALAHAGQYQELAGTLRALRVLDGRRAALHTPWHRFAPRTPWEVARASGGVDPEVIPICDVLNAIPTIATTQSCCGHGDAPFDVWFVAGDARWLFPIARGVDRNYGGYGFIVEVQITDLKKDRPVLFRLTSSVPADDRRGEALTGAKAYAAADALADRIRDLMGRPDVLAMFGLSVEDERAREAVAKTEVNVSAAKPGLPEWTEGARPIPLWEGCHVIHTTSGHRGIAVERNGDRWTVWFTEGRSETCAAAYLRVDLDNPDTFEGVRRRLAIELGAPSEGVEAGVLWVPDPLGCAEVMGWRLWVDSATDDDPSGGRKWWDSGPLACGIETAKVALAHAWKELT